MGKFAMKQHWARRAAIKTDVIPAKAGIHRRASAGQESCDAQTRFWIPAFAGMTWCFRYLLLFLILVLLTIPALAEQASLPAASVYNIADVAVDVTADSAAKARDQAIAEAQRAAFTQLLERLGAAETLGDKLGNDDLATLVQNFEVRNERSSSVRYLGTFAVQFRPGAVRSFLNKHNASFSDAQGKPVIVLPVVKNGDSILLWEEQTRWQKLWSKAAHDGGRVPVIVPAGSAEDKTLLSAADAAAGKADPIKSLIDKYKAGGAVVAVLNGSADNPAPGFTVDLQHFANDIEDGSEVEHITLAGTADKNAVDALLTQGIKQIRAEIEKDSREEQKRPPAPAAAPVSVSAMLDEETIARLPVTVQFATLAEFADVQRRLLATPGVRRVDVLSVGRGATEIELGFTGTPQDIQAAAAQHNLRLNQDILSGQWMLKSF
jgi:hypothetical protein